MGREVDTGIGSIEDEAIRRKKQYQRDYYLRNRARIAARRMNAYRNNPEYRERVKRTARETYRRRAAKKEGIKGHCIKVIDGTPVFSISFVAAACGRQPELLRAWEKAGIIPQSTYTDKRGWRLYTEHQMNVLAQAFALFSLKKLTKKTFRQYVDKYWEE